jgi:hypothetical protein
MSYTLLLTLAIGCIFTQSDQIYKQLEFYHENSYQYAYEFSNSVEQNDYLKCSSVYFYSDNTTTKSIHGDCFMVLADSEYNQVTPLKTTSTLDAREIAISENLAQKHGLSIGSVVYSNHHIKNKTETYTIVEILPVCYGISRVDFDINYGVILMGYDRDYQENTDYSYVAFFDDDPYKSLQLTNAGLIDIKAKETFESSLLQRLIIWQCIILLGVAAFTVLYSVIHWKYQKGYYSRLSLFGCQPKSIKRQVLLDMIVPGALGLILSSVLSVVLCSVRNMYLSYTTTLVSIAFGFIILITASIIISRKGRKI